MKDVAIEKFNEEGISFNKYYWKQDDKYISETKR